MPCIDRHLSPGEQHHWTLLLLAAYKRLEPADRSRLALPLPPYTGGQITGFLHEVKRFQPAKGTPQPLAPALEQRRGQALACMGKALLIPVPPASTAQANAMLLLALSLEIYCIAAMLFEPQLQEGAAMIFVQVAGCWLLPPLLAFLGALSIGRSIWLSGIQGRIIVDPLGIQFPGEEPLLWSCLDTVMTEGATPSLALVCDRSDRSLVIAPGIFPEADAAFAYACHMLEIGEETWSEPGDTE
jgi:hypothetical protein